MNKVATPVKKESGNIAVPTSAAIHARTPESSHMTDTADGGGCGGSEQKDLMDEELDELLGELPPISERLVLPQTRVQQLIHT